MGNGPLANYKEQFSNEIIGYNVVGPGWRSILKTLDNFMLPGAYRDEPTITVLQVKEKFGGLRVYWSSPNMIEESRQFLSGCCAKAEELSFKTCEKCGSEEGVETRPKGNVRMGRALTLCAIHHEERDNNTIFDMGNGDLI